MMKILYVCTHNRCRSILCEAITRQLAPGVIEVRSAGSHPAGQVHPLSLKYLAEAGYATTGLSSQSWDDFQEFSPDIVITVCDSAAGESCPVWFGKSLKVHWGLEDPSKLEGTDEEKAEAFRNTIALIEQRANSLRVLAASQRDQWPEALENLGAKL